MYTIPQLVEILDLETENQVRNRIEALRDLLAGHLRRGPNNQLLVTETGLEHLRSLQALCETGHTLKEAACLIHYSSDQQDNKFHRSMDETAPDRTTPDGGWQALAKHLAEQVRALEARVAALEAKAQAAGGQGPWWERWR